MSNPFLLRKRFGEDLFEEEANLRFGEEAALRSGEAGLPLGPVRDKSSAKGVLFPGKEKKTDGSPFLSLEDRESFSAPKEKLEQEYAEAYRNWKRKNTEENRNRMLAVLDPFLRQYVRSLPGTDPNYMAMQAKILAIRSLPGYDPSQGSLRTWLSRQLMPLRRTAREQMNILDVPERILLAAQQLESSELELQDDLGRLPTTEELADRLGVSARQIEKIRRSTHAGNTGSYLVPDEEGGAGGTPAVTRTLPDEYRHQYVLSALKSDPNAALIYEHDHGIGGRRPLSTEDLARLLHISPGSVSQRRSKIREIATLAERMIYGGQSGY
jgi:DNA-directed RNA polymerase specialized sigma subunit